MLVGRVAPRAPPETPVAHSQSAIRNPRSKIQNRKMDLIHIHDLEVFYRVGVPDEERVTPQRLLLDLQLHLDFRGAAATDELTKTINYFAVTQRLLKFGENREWRLIEKLVEDIATILLTEFR